MRAKLALLVAVPAIVALVAGSISALAVPAPKATGGGQTDVGTRGAGDTIAFVAQGSGDSVSGQTQYVDREGGTGQGQTVFHGRVTCLEVEENVATLGGNWAGGGGYEVVVIDNGNGAGQDAIGVFPDEGAMPDCERDEDPEDETAALARGNAQVRDDG